MTDVSDSDFYGPSDDGFGRSLRLIMLQDSGSSTNVSIGKLILLLLLVVDNSFITEPVYS
jgi:hypothetical protein